MITFNEVTEIFKRYLPPDVTVLNVDAEPFTSQAKGHPYIQLQMQMGVYSDKNITTDFLSIARAHVSSKLVVVCMELIEGILDGIPDNVARDYIAHVAAHEAHHFHDEHTPVSALEHSQSELNCIREIDLQHPNLVVAVQYVEMNSPVYRRVFQRLDQIKERIS